jgi:hypothetical protein
LPPAVQPPRTKGLLTVNRVCWGLAAIFALHTSLVAHAGPPRGFLERCQAETQTRKQQLLRQMRRATSSRRKELGAELWSIDQGELVAPPLESFEVGEVGRWPIPVDTAVVIKQEGKRAVVFELPVPSGAQSSSDRKSASSRRIRLEGISSRDLKVNKSQDTIVSVPRVLEVVSDIDGIPTLRAFDLRAWAASQRKRKPNASAL